MWEKEEMLVTSIFSFSHHVFYLLRHKSFENSWIFCQEIPSILFTSLKFFHVVKGWLAETEACEKAKVTVITFTQNSWNLQVIASFYHTISCFNAHGEAFENNVGKGENAGNFSHIIFYFFRHNIHHLKKKKENESVSHDPLPKRWKCHTTQFCLY